MSELKAFTFGLGQYTENGSPCVVAFDDEENPRLAYDEKFYLKSEADKVIADLESKNTQLRKDKANLLNDNENLKLEIKSQKLGRLTDKLQYNITEHHHKFKRCLAMALYCHESAMWLEENGINKSTVFMLRWEKRWLELAEKFKEAK